MTATPRGTLGMSGLMGGGRVMGAASAVSAAPEPEPLPPSAEALRPKRPAKPPVQRIPLAAAC